MLPIITGEDKSILRTRCQPVTMFDEKLKRLVSEMTETMLEPEGEHKVRGVGLAAPQVDVDARVMLVTFNVATKKDHKVVTMINPEIVETSEQMVKLEEGCLSLPGVFGKVSRPAKVKARWQNVDGNWCEKKLDGWDARIFLHEYDHLEGVLFIDYLDESQIERQKR